MELTCSMLGTQLTELNAEKKRMQAQNASISISGMETLSELNQL